MFGCCQVIGAHLALLRGEELPLWGKGKNPSAPSRDEGLVSLVLPATAVCHRRVGHQLSFFPLQGLKAEQSVCSCQCTAPCFHLLLRFLCCLVIFSCNLDVSLKNVTKLSTLALTTTSSALRLQQGFQILEFLTAEGLSSTSTPQQVC